MEHQTQHGMRWDTELDTEWVTKWCNGLFNKQNNELEKERNTEWDTKVEHQDFSVTGPEVEKVKPLSGKLKFWSNTFRQIAYDYTSPDPPQNFI